MKPQNGVDKRHHIGDGLVMTLAQFLEAEGLSFADFARRIGVSTEAVRRYATEGRIPKADVMRGIIETTEGRVQPNDFFPGSGATATPSDDAHQSDAA